MVISIKQSQEDNLDYWLSQLEARHYADIKLRLDKLKPCAEKLELTKLDSPVVTVAGTNGKGSTIATMESLLFEAGYTVASFTSPHLFKFNERLKFNKAVVSDNDWIFAFKKLLPQIPIELSYFEVITLVGLYILKQKKPDYYLLEIGLGGRLDAINVVANDVAIITSIGLDHCSYLGNTREEIAYEKSGIIKKNTVVLSSDLKPPAVIATTAKKQKAKLLQLGLDYRINQNGSNWDLVFPNGKFLNLKDTGFPCQNAATAIMALLELNIILSPKLITKGLDKINIPGRWQIVKKEIDYIFDVAHNGHATKWLHSKLKSYLRKKPAKSKVFAIFGSLATKDLKLILEPMVNCIYTWYPLKLDSKIVSYSTDAIKDEINNLKPNSKVCILESLKEVLLDIKANSSPLDIVLIFGSFVTVSQVWETLCSDNVPD